MKTLESTSMIAGEKTIVKFSMRTGKELLEAMSGAKVPELPPEVEKQLDRIAVIMQWTINRHHLLPECRDAGEVVQGKYTSKTDEGKKKEQKWGVAFMKRIKAGEVFDLLDFLPDEGGNRIPVGLKPHWAQAKVMYAAAKDDPAKVARAKTKFGEFSVEAIAKALKAIADSQPDLF